MLYDEKEVMEVCKKYGIKTVKKNGMPLYKGKEMDENFSFSEMMHEPIRVKRNTRDKVLAHVKCLKRKLKLKCEMYLLQARYCFYI